MKNRHSKCSFALSSYS